MPSIPRRGRMEEFERLCRERRLPLTSQRRLVLETILAREDHPTADQLCDAIRVRLPGISRTTVYRILDTLVQTGMITKICHPGSAARFDPKIRQHHHLVCMHCERIIDVESPRLDRVPWPDVRNHGFKISDYRIHFRGTCAGCRRRPRGARRETKPAATKAASTAGSHAASREPKERRRR